VRHEFLKRLMIRFRAEEIVIPYPVHAAPWDIAPALNRANNVDNSSRQTHGVG